MYAIYNLAWAVAAPGLRAWLRRHPRHGPLLARFDPEIPADVVRPLWVHACSVGEVTTAKPILQALRQRFAGAPILLSTSTATGRDLADRTCAGCPVTWFPFDAPGSVRQFLEKAQPRILILIETELWPNVLRECRRRGIPAVIVNGRLSDKHFPRYRRWRPFFQAVFGQLTAVGVQNQVYADRMTALGVDAAKVHITGNTKFDAVAAEVDEARRARLKAENGFPEQAPILVFGSTRPGDEALAGACWHTLRTQFPDLRLVVAPRHLERMDEALQPFDEPVLRRSEVKQGRTPNGERVFFLDTVGELALFYSLGSVAVVGGSFFPGVNGHNPLEPAALGVPTVFGPYMSNFPDPAAVLLAAKGAIQVPSPERLGETLAALLNDPEESARMAARGRDAILSERGAIERNVDLVEAVLQHSSPPSVR